MARLLIGNIKGPQGAQGIQGPQGPVGATGPQGPMPDLVNNALATEAGVAALDAAMGKTLQDQIAQQNSNLTSIDSRFMSYGFITSLEIDFSALRTGLYLLLTNYEICTVVRYTANIGTKKIVESTLRPITLTEDGYKLTVTSTTSVLLSVLFVGR